MEQSPEKLVELDVLKELKITVVNILSVVVPVMQQLQEDNNEIVDEVVYCCGTSTEKLDKTKVNKWLQKKSLELVAEPQKISNEIDAFIKVYLTGTDNLEKHMKEYGVLAEVWFGDTYDGKEGISSIKELLKDMVTEFEKISKSDFFVKLGTDRFKGSTTKK